MEIIRNMAGVTIRGRAFELQIGVALCADNADMLAGQLEDGIVVIEVAGLPSAGCVAVGALISKRAAMRVCVAVTGGAV